MHSAVFRVKAELDQLIHGLESLGVLDLFQRNPVKMRILLVKRTPVRFNADAFFDHYSLLKEATSEKQKRLQWSFGQTSCSMLKVSIVVLNVLLSEHRRNTMHSPRITIDTTMSYHLPLYEFVVAIQIPQ